MATQDWEQRAAAKRDAVNSLIPTNWRLANIPSADQQRDITGSYLHQFLTAQEIEITETSVEGILQNTTTGAWTAESVTKAFSHRAALVHQHVNCLIEIFFEAALEDARQLDVFFAANKKPVGPLHGLPVSLKDQFHVKGVETSMAYVGWIGTFQGKQGTGKERVFESEMVRELRNLGAVLYCKTTVPPTLMSPETVSNIFGYTYNPKNRNLSSGGSSGGEGALIGAKGSPVGFGTDIGGSVRIPASACGLYGLRPSGGRLPYEGMANSMDGQNSLLSVVGPISGSIAGLNIVFKALLSQQPWLHDPLVLEIPWREEQHSSTLKQASTDKKFSFGVLWHDGMQQPHPPIKRALEMVVNALRKDGNEVLEWAPPSHEQGLLIAEQIWGLDGGADCFAAFELSGERAPEQIKVGYELNTQRNATEIAAINVAKRDYQKEYMEYWNSTASLTKSGRPVDAILCPAAPFPAARPTKYRHVGYTTIFNVVDYTASVLPITTVDKTIDQPFVDFKAFNADDQETQNDYDPEIYDGAHVPIQVVGRRLQEEKVLALTEYISGLMSTGK